MIRLKYNLIIENNKIIYRNKIYEDFQVENLINNIKGKLRIIILGENLWVKIINCQKKNYNKCIEDEIKLVNEPGADLLYHNERDIENKQIVLYSIKGKSLIEKLSWNREHIKVIPIQFLLLSKVIKNKKYYSRSIVMAKVNYHYYIIKINKGRIISSDVAGIEGGKMSILKVLSVIKDEKLVIDNFIYNEIKGILEEEKIIYSLLEGNIINDL